MLSPINRSLNLDSKLGRLCPGVVIISLPAEQSVADGTPMVPIFQRRSRRAITRQDRVVDLSQWVVHAPALACCSDRQHRVHRVRPVHQSEQRFPTDQLSCDSDSPILLGLSQRERAQDCGEILKTVRCISGPTPCYIADAEILLSLRATPTLPS